MFAGKKRFVSLASVTEKSLVLSQQEATNNKFMKKNRSLFLKSDTKVSAFLYIQKN